MEKRGVVAFAFGTPSTIRSNMRIAQIASEKARRFNVLVYTQTDISLDPNIVVCYAEQKPGEPPPTLRIARGAVSWAKSCGINKLHVVAAKPHMWRVVRDLERAVRESKKEIEVFSADEINDIPGDFWFCPDSTQLRTASRKNWERREWILRAMPFFLYKLVAG